MSACVEWHQRNDKDGYGIVAFGGKPRRVHRFVFWLQHGHYPAVVRHTCDNPACYNVEHLEGGTQADNVRDMMERGRHNTPDGGETHPNAKYSDAKVKDVLRLLADGHMVDMVASMTGVSASQVRNYKRGGRS